MARRILLVDSDAADMERLTGILESDGHKILQTGTGQEALRLARDERPDLLVMDVELPDLGGDEVCRILKGSNAFGFLPIILLTEADQVEKLELVADDYLSKPIRFVEFRARVKSMLRLKGLQDELLRANERLMAVNERLQELSSIDSLTGLHNRLSFEKRMRYEFQRTERYGKPLSLLMCDLDHFKKINDSLGHPFGDRVLRAVADCLVDCVRIVDLVARWGGEEMVVALPECNEENAAMVAERIRAKVEGLDIQAEGQRSGVTISIGAAQVPDPRVRSVEDLLDLADKALYAAKAQGRNRVCVTPPAQSDE